jgi:hypothetical protein
MRVISGVDGIAILLLPTPRLAGQVNCFHTRTLLFLFMFESQN